MHLTVRDIARMIDLSAVRAENSEEEVRRLAELARAHQCVAVFTLPTWTSLIANLLADEKDIAIGGVVGFPSGAHSTGTKITEARALVAEGCTELDMVLNIGKMLSGLCEEVEQDIHAVVEAAGDTKVKVILECHYLSDDQIRQACEICRRAGAAWVKTGTGWAPTGATPERIRLMKDCVGDDLGVKAAGGVRGLDMLVDLYRCGARRFGVGVSSGLAILEECAARPGGAVEI